ncbi:hypothetical protein Hypma_014179 [Hypsizygus marmoreus]|uniref:Uncharacterized protein n=1 Tax=Hypsizygus marmoreus TaxID=39966 RepID=A0A369K5G5_HYPMA|nr:hypothetical protein Hypma_014179 [Hypsizygus marmoreus]
MQTPAQSPEYIYGKIISSFDLLVRLQLATGPGFTATKFTSNSTVRQHLSLTQVQFTPIRSTRTLMVYFNDEKACLGLESRRQDVLMRSVHSSSKFVLISEC